MYYTRGQSFSLEVHERPCGRFCVISRLLCTTFGFSQAAAIPHAVACLCGCFLGSSERSELYALVEGSREASLGARCAVGHILGHEREIVTPRPKAAVNISKMEGLRKLRHIDIRACFIQTEVQAGAIKVFSVKGTENPADIFTKNLDLNSTLKHMQALGLCSTLLPEGVRGLASSVLRACVVRETPSLRERGFDRTPSTSGCLWSFALHCCRGSRGFVLENSRGYTS